MPLILPQNLDQHPTFTQFCSAAMQWQWQRYGVVQLGKQKAPTPRERLGAGYLR